ncbi:peptidylprolyl isomerase [Aurantivibrio plasticivorans]
MTGKFSIGIPHKLRVALSFYLLLLISPSLYAESTQDDVIVSLETDLGTITVQLFKKEAPITVENFLHYVNSGFYDGTQFHRVVPGFVVQGGGFTFDFVEKETADPIINEAGNGLPNTRGTLSMARTPDPDSATSQFFINLAHNVTLDYSEHNPGYAVFGQVIDGMDVVDAIVAIPRGRYRTFPEAPNDMIRILKASVSHSAVNE